MKKKARAAEEKGPRFRRVLLKLSGEALQGTRRYNIDPQVVHGLAEEIRDVRALGVDVAMTVGGGNIFRGKPAAGGGMDRVNADYMGMLATVINAMAIQDALEQIDVDTRVLSAIEMKQICEPFIRRRAVRHMEKGRVVIFAGGTGNPYFSSDTTAALRAAEVEADVILKATKVDGIYDADPVKEPRAKMFREITYREVISRSLQVMDGTATTLCMENKIPIIVFNLTVPGNIRRVVAGEGIGTIVRGEIDA